MLILYGIANCDTVKKARAWLALHQQGVTFHDFKKSGVPPEQLQQWVATLGRDRLINRQGSTWRKLGLEVQARVTGDAQAIALMQAHPSLIKRPVVDWGHSLTVGFDATTWTQQLARTAP